MFWQAFFRRRMWPAGSVSTSQNTGRSGVAVDAAAIITSEPGLNGPWMNVYTSLCVEDTMIRVSEGHARSIPNVTPNTYKLRIRYKLRRSIFSSIGKQH